MLHFSYIIITLLESEIQPQHVELVNTKSKKIIHLFPKKTNKTDKINTQNKNKIKQNKIAIHSTHHKCTNLTTQQKITTIITQNRHNINLAVNIPSIWTFLLSFLIYPKQTKFQTNKKKKKQKKKR